MSNEIVLRLKPEEEELLRKRDELAGMRGVLAERELALTEFRSKLAVFEGRYLRKVGVLYAELDDWWARIAELEVLIEPSDEAQERAEEAREQATESYEAAHGEASETKEVEASADLKTMFREAAKCIHPDFAKDDVDRANRTRYMAEANDAYSRGDAESLQRIMDDYRESAPLETEETVGTELVRIIRQLASAKKHIESIERELMKLRMSDLADHMAREASAAEDGWNYLDGLADDLKEEITEAILKYQKLSDEVPQSE